MLVLYVILYINIVHMFFHVNARYSVFINVNVHDRVLYKNYSKCCSELYLNLYKEVHILSLLIESKNMLWLTTLKH